jgi:hypothetical protein
MPEDNGKYKNVPTNQISKIANKNEGADPLRNW